MSAVDVIRRVVRPLDVAIGRLSQQTPARRMRFMEQEGITVAIDVGAHVGEYGVTLRDNGFEGLIESYEPRSAAFSRLRERCDPDPLWRCHKLAIGTSESKGQLHVAANEASSSLLPMTDILRAAAPGASYTGDEIVDVFPLDAVLLLEPSVRALLKIDVQGYELQVLEGSARTLEQVPLVEMELSIDLLYGGQMLFSEALNYMSNLGYKLMWIERGLQHPDSGRLLQLDGLFCRV